MTSFLHETCESIAGRRILFNAASADARPLDWARTHRDDVNRFLQDRGALLVRGMKFHSTRQFGQFLEALFEGGLASYRYRSTPRTKLGGNVYTATEYHHAETIPQHNESCYASTWPMRIGFFCLVAPAEGAGGATPIADSRAVYARLPSDIVEKFERLGVQYVRNYGVIDLPWSEVFQTTDRAEVEAFCRSNGIKFEWLGENGLRTRQTTPSSALHPVTGEKLWFNQAHLFHVSALGAEASRDMLGLYREDDLPRNAYYGDGTRIEEAALSQIRDAYERETFHFSWQKDDVLLLDNMLYTHGRQPYQGERKIVVGMAGLHGHAI